MEGRKTLSSYFFNKGLHFHSALGPADHAAGRARGKGQIQRRYFCNADDEFLESSSETVPTPFLTTGIWRD